MQCKKTILKNGLRVVTVPMHDNPAVTVLVMVEAGSKYEDQKTNGISHFLEHMVFKGTPRRPKASQISLELDSIGAHYNAFTGQEYTGYYAKVDPRHLDTALDIVSDMYLNPLFDAGEIKKESGVIVEEIRMYQDMPQRHVQDLIMDALYGDQPAGWNIAGTETNVKGFTREDFVKYRAAHYVPKATTVVVAGSFDEASILSKIENYFSAMPEGEKSTKLAVKDEQSKAEVKIEYKETDQTHLVLAMRAFHVKDEKIPAARVLSTILGGGMSSRLFRKLRDEMGVGYYVRAENDPFTDHGVFSVSTGVDTTRVKEVISAILYECAMLRDTEVGEAELKKAKDYITGTMMLSLESSDSQAEYCGFQEILKGSIELPEEIAAKIQAVTAQDVQECARQIFRDENITLALIGRFKDSKEFLSLLKFA